MTTESLVHPVAETVHDLAHGTLIAPSIDGASRSVRAEGAAALGVNLRTGQGASQATIIPIIPNAQWRPAPNMPALRLALTTVPAGKAARAAKRTLDVAGASVLMLILLPVFMIIALAILLDDGRPVIFRQERAGRAGKPFRIFKFRTMHRGADEQRDELRAQNEINGAAFKLSNDPRITRVGATLRRFSFDELPQLWNVLIGEMSLVGPRPHTFDDVERYEPWHYRRLAATPGMTGLWQILGRRDPYFDRWVQQDVEYIERWTIRLDLEILVRTVPVVLRGDGR